MANRASVTGIDCFRVEALAPLDARETTGQSDSMDEDRDYEAESATQEVSGLLHRRCAERGRWFHWQLDVESPELLPPEPELRSSKHQFSMGGWLLIKLLDSLENLHVLVEHTRTDGSMSQESRSFVMSMAQRAGYDVVRSMSLGSTQEFQPDHGHAALKDCASYYRIVRLYRDGADYEEHDRLGEAAWLASVADHLSQFFREGHEGRTWMSLALRQYESHLKHVAGLRHLSDLTERASMGTVTWTVYAAGVRDQLDQFRVRAESLRRPQSPRGPTADSSNTRPPRP